jgi:hypothetical protein
MKRPAGAKHADPVKRRCKSVKEAIEGCDIPERIQNMLLSTIPVTIGAFQANRHPFNERFVAMIGEVLTAEQTRLTKDVDTKEAAFAELTPAKALRETALEEARTVAEAKTEALDTAKRAVTEIGAKLKELNASLKEAQKAQKVGDEDLEAQSSKKAELEAVVKDSLAPLLDGSSGEEKATKTKAVLDVGRSFKFDSSLLSTAEPVLQKEVADRGSFDATCLEQLQAAFNGTIAAIDQTLAAGAPDKAERASVVEQAEAAKQAAETSLAELKEKAAAAKEAKAAADAAERSASQSVHDFMPDMKNAGDALDEVKEELKEFTEGALQAFNELKDVKEGDFKDEIPTGSSYYETIDGLRCDRAIIDSCRTAVSGTSDGRVSVEDARKVFEHVADGNKETSCERWTVRYCLQEFKWTDEAHDWLVEELKKVPQAGLSGSPAKKARTSGGGYYEKVDGFACDRAVIDACREAMGDGRVSEEDARKVWEKAADGTQVTDAEKWTLRYCLSSFNWSRPAHDWLLEQLQKA